MPLTRGFSRMVCAGQLKVVLSHPAALTWHLLVRVHPSTFWHRPEQSFPI